MKSYVLVWDDQQLDWLINLTTMLRQLRPNWSQTFNFNDEDVTKVHSGLGKDKRELQDWRGDDGELIFDIFHTRGAETVNFQKYCCLLTDTRLEKNWRDSNKKYLNSSCVELTSGQKLRYGLSILGKKCLSGNPDMAIILVSNYFGTPSERLEILEEGEGKVFSIFNKDDLQREGSPAIEHSSHIIISSVLRWEKRIQNEELKVQNQRLNTDNNELRRQIKNEKKIIGHSNALAEVKQLIDKAANSDKVTVFIRGESGTGKELVAKEIHKKSRRCNEPFIARNMTCISPTLIANELFGHVKGAFTSAIEDKSGIFEEAKEGTIFLDEIGDMPLEQQASLLRVLQDGEYQKVGSVKNKITNARIIIATHRDLFELVRAKKFREDLYYRINVFDILCPKLIYRKSDIPELAEYFSYQFSVKYDKSIENIENSAMELLKSYHWPGNIRQLENIIESAVIHAEGSVITSSNIRKLLDACPSVTQIDDVPAQKIDTFKCQLTGIQISRDEAVLAQKIMNEIASKVRPPNRPGLIIPRNRKMIDEAKELDLPTEEGFGWAFLLLWYSDYWKIGGGDENLKQTQIIFGTTSTISVWRKTRDIIKAFIKENKMQDRNPKSDNLKNEYGMIFKKWLEAF